MTLVQMRHHDALTLWYGPIHTNKFAIFAHGIDLKQCQLVLKING
jgi:hypothetical protein